jgi:hypothetical protein
MNDDKRTDQIEMLEYIRFGHKYKDKKSSFTFVPMDVTLRDPEENYMGTAYCPVIHLIGTFSSIDAPDIQRIDQRLSLNYVFHEMYHYDEKNKF